MVEKLNGVKVETGKVERNWTTKQIKVINNAQNGNGAFKKS